MSQDRTPGVGLILRARHRKGLTIAQLAEKAGVGNSSVSAAERRPNPTVGSLATYGHAMGLTLVVYYLDPEGAPIE